MKTNKYFFDELNGFYKKFYDESELLSLGKNDFFVEKDKICNYIGIVESGSLISYFENDAIEKKINGIYTPKSIVTSYRSFLTQTLSDGFIQAYTNSTIRVISYKKYIELQKETEWLTYFKILGDELFVNKCKKETSHVLFSAKDRYQQLILQRPNIEQFFAQHIIASYLNIRPETLSRLKSRDLHQD